MKLIGKSGLNTALEACYLTFAAPTPSIIEGCPCCISNRGVDVLLTTPLRELTGQQLWKYVSGAFLTIGGEEDFRYFLPRIFDISVHDPANANHPEIVIGKLQLSNWRKWPKTEQSVIEEFLNVWFDWAMANDLAEIEEGWLGTDTESVLCGAARAGIPLRSWLARLEAPFALPVLSDLKKRFPGELSAFWEDAPSGLAELSAFLNQSKN
ncbi:hypothetical protein [Sphingorhabdus contaminans]|uniref:Uncharacterized protein n=1 Tax=Sphingorhabdus contaminans TaxID=1343899 RepID=A0A553W9W6_9SPHN|nr:hypothetical protein [Sphingorhabdus contaminans]TSB01473.1 hypothetical protein FOM92_09780 [Sphingorhabdus contaminans]